MKNKQTWRPKDNNTSWQLQRKRWAKEKELDYKEQISQLTMMKNFWKTMTFIFVGLFIVALCI